MRVYNWIFAVPDYAANLLTIIPARNEAATVGEIVRRVGAAVGVISLESSAPFRAGVGRVCWATASGQAVDASSSRIVIMVFIFSALIGALPPRCCIPPEIDRGSNRAIC